MKINNMFVGIAGIFLFVAAGLPQTAVAVNGVNADELDRDLSFHGPLVLPDPNAPLEAHDAAVSGMVVSDAPSAHVTKNLAQHDDQPTGIVDHHAGQDGNESL